jgi:hypothetical protein
VSSYFNPRFSLTLISSSPSPVIEEIKKKQIKTPSIPPSNKQTNKHLSHCQNKQTKPERARNTN